MDIQVFERKTFRVKAVQVTSENILEVGSWCKGKVKISIADDHDKSYVEIPVAHIMGHEKTARAYIGSWVTCLTEANSFRAYKNAAFTEAFKEIRSREEMYEEILKIFDDSSNPYELIDRLLAKFQ